MFIFKTVHKNDKIVDVGSDTNESIRPRTSCVCPSPSTTGPLRHNVLYSVSLIGVMDGMAAISCSVEKCLKNTKILQKIFNHVSEDPTDNLEIRLVNRLFDVEYLHRIRRTHRNIILKFSCDHYNQETRETYYTIKVNEHVMKTTEAEKYFKFLTEIVKIRVESLRAKVENEFSKIYSDGCIGFHTLLMETLLKNCRLKVLTGMEPMCPKGCSECVRHARTCEEYGPLQMNVYFDSYQEPRHYNKLIVSEVLLHALANQAVYQTKTREDCLEFVKAYRHPNISCRDFCLSAPETCQYHLIPRRPQRPGYVDEVFPREIIDELCQKWKPKSVQVIMRCQRTASESRSDWRFKNFFTEFTFKQKLPDYQKRHRMEFESLDIDLRDAINSSYYLYKEGEQSCNHLIANFRNLFHSTQVSVKTRRYPSTKMHSFKEEVFNEATFRRILETVWEKNPEKHWTLTLNYMLKDVKFQIPESFLFMNGQISCVPLAPFPAEQTNYHLLSKKDRLTRYSVQPYRIIDKAMDRVLNFQLFVEIETNYQNEVFFIMDLLMQQNFLLL